MTQEYTTLTLAIAAILVGAVGCEQRSACERNGVAIEIVGDPAHTAEIPTAHVGPGKGGTYPVRGAADHEHAVALRDQDFATLKSGAPVTTVVSSVKGHTHEATLRCK